MRAGHTLETNRTSSKQRLLTTVVVAGILAINLWSLMRFPYPFVDEAWAASRAWAFIETGRQFGPLDAGVFDRFDGHWTLFPWLPTFIQSLSLHFVAQPELLPLRILSLLFGLLLLGAVYAIANRLYDWRHGLFSILLVSVSQPFLYSGHLARFDVIAAAFGFMAIALYINNRAHRFWPGLLSGLCVAAAFEVHAHGAIYVPVIGVLYLLDLRWTMFRKRHFWGFVTGGATGLLAYAALHILPYPRTYLALAQIAFGPSHVPPILTLDRTVLVLALKEMGFLVAGTYHAMVPILVLAAVVLAKRHSGADKRLLILNAALIGSALLLIRNKIFYYAILFAPALEIMIAAFLLRFVQQPWRGRLWDYVSRIVVWGCVLGALVVNLSRLRTDMSQFYQAAQTFVNRSIQPDDSIMASQTYWFGLYEHVYYSWEELIYFQRFVPGSTLEDALLEFHPTILIIDGHMSGFILDDPGESAYAQELHLSQSELDAFLDRYGELLDEFETAYYGMIRVYRLHWQDEGQQVSNPAKGMGRVPIGRHEKLAAQLTSEYSKLLRVPGDRKLSPGGVRSTVLCAANDFY